MALSQGQINDAYQAALGRFPTGAETQAAQARGDLDGDPGKFALIGELGGAGANQDPVERILEASRRAAEEAIKPFQEAGERAKQFDEENPFSFDEALARASAEERFDPFFEAELDEFVTGVQRQRQRTRADEEAVRRELTTQTENFVGRARRGIQDALQGAREGFAGAGLFFSGRRISREGRIGIEGEEQIGDTLRRAGLQERESRLREQRTLEDVGLRERGFRRRAGAQRETALQTDVAGQKTEASRQRELERQQFVGFPLATGTSSLRSIFGV